MKLLLLVLLLIAGIASGCLQVKSNANASPTGSPSGEPIVSATGATPSTVTTFVPTQAASIAPTIGSATVVEVARKYLSTKPDVESFKKFTWEEYFTDGYLARTTGKRLDDAWFKEHAPKVGNDPDGNYIVTWVGLPGCSIDASQTKDLEYGPKWYDVNGKRCFTLWQVEVYVDLKLQPLKVRISEIE